MNNSYINDVYIDQGLMERTNPVFNTAKKILYQLSFWVDKYAADIS